MNATNSSAGGWRDSELRKSMNGGIIWNVFPPEFKDNVAAVSKATNNPARSNRDKDSDAVSQTADKLWILSPSEMGLPISKQGAMMDLYDSDDQTGADVHVYGGDGGYDDTVKAAGDGRSTGSGITYYWRSEKHYLYSNDVYQWWMLPSGDRKMSDGNQSYHNTDSYSYCAVARGSNPSSNTSCGRGGSFWLRSPHVINSYFAIFSSFTGRLYSNDASYSRGVVPAFSF